MKSLVLKSLHESLGATIGEFAGWEVPMVYNSTISEHLNVRNEVGIFDVSHMGRLRLKGKDSLELLEKVFTKKIAKTKINFMSGPALALNEYARVIDDEMWYKVNDEEWLGVANAATRLRVLEHLEKVKEEFNFDAEIEDLTERYVMLAVQGPKSPEVAEKAGINGALQLKPLEFKLDIKLGEYPIFLISRSGWTGEDGFEIWVENSIAENVYKNFLEAGAKPIGIVARDTLRMEMGYVLGGNEYGEDPMRFPCAISLRYGLGSIDWEKHGYIGENALRACRREGARWIRLGAIMKKDFSRFVPRSGYKIYVEDIEVGWVTSGTYSPVLERGIAQLYIDSRYAIVGESIKIKDAKGKEAEAKLSDFPLIQKK
ncbi:glycine cleavage system aminomethyltransferase GcvT [Fervidicoccus fontis]|uniref:Glycine cleavage system aminomethyltransferase T n=1 Tax=Fervidicoccus fontis (strain DSM 19380 / JCM 18336 / VKM B-2539 / Kam940) TaxID=1163730 RepID=I0A074_FERFK|nr:glycine cleavage system aminomethyltransferase GcvT [Fervidicoccus fontis]AFH42381.1 glycine cleavage system aminomethyltransferase T [Fervidicoccus fontis Kam940]